jgi:hypothetical protein
MVGLWIVGLAEEGELEHLGNLPSGQINCAAAGACGARAGISCSITAMRKRGSTASEMTTEAVEKYCQDKTETLE